jgi:hypothetical protein
MSGYAGDNYRPGTNLERLIGGIVVAAIVFAFLAFLCYCLWTKF